MEENQNTKATYSKSFSNIWVGIIFILGGAIVLLNQFGILPFELNWWALFILMPAIGFFSGAYNRYRATGELFTMEVMFPGLLGIFMVIMSASLLVGDAWDINWSLLWPFVFIIIGLGMIFGRGRKS